MTNKIALANRLTFPQWSNKRIINGTELAVNPNDKQRYKAIFGLDFLFENKFDVMFSKAEIFGEEIGVSMFNARQPNNKDDKEECNPLDRKNIQENNYKQMHANEIVGLKNQDHLTLNKKETLEKLLCRFEDLYHGEAGSFNDLEIKFELKPGVKPYYGEPLYPYLNYRYVRG